MIFNVLFFFNRKISRFLLRIKAKGKQKPNSPACLCETVPNEIGKKMMKFTEDQQKIIRKTIEQDYKKQGWQTWGIIRSLRANQIDEYYTYILTICCDKLATTFDLEIK